MSGEQHVLSHNGVTLQGHEQHAQHAGKIAGTLEWSAVLPAWGSFGFRVHCRVMCVSCITAASAFHHQCIMSSRGLAFQLRCDLPCMLCSHVLVVEDDAVAAPGYLPHVLAIMQVR